MTTKEVGRKEWRRFCERVNQSSQGVMVSIRLIQSDGTTITVAEQTPLQGLALDEVSDACNDLILIETGLPGSKPAEHRIVEPIYIRLRNGHGDRINHLHILAENGTTVVDFSPGLSLDTIKDLAA
jgi:hypothetical protein